MGGSLFEILQKLSECAEGVEGCGEAIGECTTRPEYLDYIQRNPEQFRMKPQDIIEYVEILNNETNVAMDNQHLACCR